MKKKPLKFLNAAKVISKAMFLSAILVTSSQAEINDVEKNNYIINPVDAGSIQVNIKPDEYGVSKIQLGRMNVSFIKDLDRLPIELSSINNFINDDVIDTDFRHTSIIVLHKVFNKFDISEIKKDPQIVANEIKKEMQKELDTGYGGKSPYFIQDIYLDDVCIIRNEFLTSSCTAPLSTKLNYGDISKDLSKNLENKTKLKF